MNLTSGNDKAKMGGFCERSIVAAPAATGVPSLRPLAEWLRFVARIGGLGSRELLPYSLDVIS